MFSLWDCTIDRLLITGVFFFFFFFFDIKLMVVNGLCKTSAAFGFIHFDCFFSLSNNMSHVAKKIVFGGQRPGNTQTGLLSYRDKSYTLNFDFSKDSYYTIYAWNNKGADQIARMRRLICTFVIRIRHKTAFPMT